MDEKQQVTVMRKISKFCTFPNSTKQYVCFSGSLRQLEELELEQESLNNSLLALTSHFAQVPKIRFFNYNLNSRRLAGWIS